MSGALFSVLSDGRYQPHDHARGPWSPQALHGGPVAALVAGVAEPLLEGLQPVRLTVELLRPVPLAPLAVRAEVVRPGRKVRIASVTVTADGQVVTTATLLGIRNQDVPVAVDPARQPHEPAPPFPSDDAELRNPFANVTVVTYEAFHNRGTEHRFVEGQLSQPGPASDWIRLAGPVVAGEATTPLQRVAAAADFGNGISSYESFESLLYLNPDLTVYLHRLPEGEWVCIDAATHLEQHGVALAESRLYDRRGPIGRGLQSLLLERPTPS